MAASRVQQDMEVYVSLQGLIDVQAERQRLLKQQAEKQKHLQSTQAKLSNESFRKRAPAEIVQQQEDLVCELQNQLAAIAENLRELSQE
jgi:valyl-tRNA synthetase